MSMKFFLISFSFFLLFGCASHRTLADQTIREAELLGSWMEKTASDTAQFAGARESLNDAKKLRAENDYQKAYLKAEIGILEYRLAIASVVQDSVMRENKALAEKLQQDMERELQYQSLLKKELQNRGEL